MTSLAYAVNPYTDWTFAPLVLTLAALALAFFVHGWRRLRRRGRPDLAPVTRLVTFASGVLVTVTALVSPIDAIGEAYLQSAHMLQHVMIADFGVALIVFSLRGPLAVFFIPRHILAPLARTRWLRRGLRWLLRPTATVVTWVAVLVVWHVPVVYDAALRHRVVHDLEHLSFVLVGTMLWIQLIDPTRHRRLTVGERIGLATLVFWVSQILAYVIVFDTRPLFDSYVEQERRLFGLSPLTDQKIAGVVMMIEQSLTIGACLLWLIRVRTRSQAATGHAPAADLPGQGAAVEGRDA